MREHPTYDEQKQYYDREWSSWLGRKLCEDEVYREEFIVHNVKKLACRFEHKPRIIDLGCGPGWIANSLSKYGDVVGVDMSISVAKKSYPNLELMQANIITGRIRGEYDIVVSSEVIEHMSLEDQKLYVKKAFQLLKEAGYLILTTPNASKARELRVSREHLQPIENWMDEKTLQSLLYPYFRIMFIGSTMFYPVLFSKHKYAHGIYGFLIFHSKLYKVINKLLNSSDHGLYLTAVAQRETKLPSSCQ
jgi:2-polyprenyl-3-methyl-5-hydroxy-6-metoxy-1,4-benzoquinol methylase